MNAPKQLPYAEPARPEEGDLLDWSVMGAWARVVLSSPRRSPRLAVTMVVLAVGAALASLWALPKTYRSEVRIQAERNLVLSALGNPGRTIPGEADSPTRAAAETILRRDNLVALIREVNLVKEWDQSRAPIVRLKDIVFRAIGGQRSDDDKIDALVVVLEKAIKVEPEAGTLTIRVEWPDARVAYGLVNAAHRNFLEERHAVEVAMIVDALSILEEHARDARERIDTSMAQIRKLHREAPVTGGTRRVVGALPAPRGSRSSPEVRQASELRAAIAATRRAIEDLEEARHRQVAALQADLMQKLSTYAPAHPNVVSTRQALEGLSVESSQTAQLKAREKDLIAEYVRRTGQQPAFDDNPVTPLPVEASREIVISASPRSGEQDDLLEYARVQLRMHASKYEELIGRIESARIELDTARAAFKYRYSVLKPAQLPKQPIRPIAPLTIVGGVVAGLLLALAACSLREMSRGLLIEPWQIERMGLPVVATTWAPE